MKQKEYGYTFVELLVVLVVMVTVGSLVVAVLVGTLRGSNKTTSLSQLRQNGNYTMSIVSQSIRDASSFNGVSTSSSYTSPQTSCVETSVAAGTPTPTPTQYKSIQITNFDGGVATFACTTISGVATIASNSASFIDTGTFSMPTCYFTCWQNTILDNPVIGIYFTIQQGVSGIDTASAIPFETTVVVRNH